jgi:hypothetical protein
MATGHAEARSHKVRKDIINNKIFWIPAYAGMTDFLFFLCLSDFVEGSS